MAGAEGANDPRAAINSKQLEKREKSAIIYKRVSFLQQKCKVLAFAGELRPGLLFLREVVYTNAAYCERRKHGDGPVKKER